jgi:hypothetical protein
MKKAIDFLDRLCYHIDMEFKRSRNLKQYFLVKHQGFINRNPSIICVTISGSGSPIINEVTHENITKKNMW